MKTVLDKIINNELKSLQGARAAIKLPLSQALLNELAQETAGQAEALESLQFELRGNQKIALHLSGNLRLIFKARLNRTLVLELSDHIPANGQFSPLARLVEIEGGMGAAEKQLLKWLSNTINANLPPFIQFENNRLSLNLHQLLSDGKYAFTSRYIDQLYLQTEAEPPRLWIKTEVDIKEIKQH
jgi:hypothetical protein